MNDPKVFKLRGDILQVVCMVLGLKGRRSMLGLRRGFELYECLPVVCFYCMSMITIVWLIPCQIRLIVQSDASSFTCLFADTAV